MRKPILLLCLLLLGMSSSTAQETSITGDLEILTWWTAEGDTAAITALIEGFTAQYPNVNVTHTALEGQQAAANELITRLLAGTLPDIFLVEGGRTLQDLWISAERLEPLNDLYSANGWNETLDATILDLVSDADGQRYGVPLNIQRTNILWHLPNNLSLWDVAPPNSWEEFLSETCPTLKEQGIEPLALGDSSLQMILWENIALAKYGIPDYRALWSATADYTGMVMQDVWRTYRDVVQNCTSGELNYTWQEASERVRAGTAAFTLLPDWVGGFYTTTMQLTPRTDFDWTFAPATGGMYLLFSEVFVMPQNAPNPVAAYTWLSYVASVAGQDAFNSVRGSLPAHKAANLAELDLYSEFTRSSAQIWELTSQVVPSFAKGAAAPPSFRSGFPDILTTFHSDEDITAAIRAMSDLGMLAGLVPMPQ
jgi:glucose/mannose transport system substrate-binding protein